MYENNNAGFVNSESPAGNFEVNSLTESAFGKGLAATIMCWFPIASIIAIFFGSTALNLAARARGLATQYGINVGGKNTAANVLGKIGKIAGIIMTVFWGLYIFFIAAIVANI